MVELTRFTDELDVAGRRKQGTKDFGLSVWESELTCTEMNKEHACDGVGE